MKEIIQNIYLYGMEKFGVGFLFIVFGLCIAIGGGKIPPYGFKKGRQLLDEYNEKIKRAETPTLDQQGAYYTFMFYDIGFWLVMFGILFGAIKFFSEFLIK